MASSRACRETFAVGRAFRSCLTLRVRAEYGATMRQEEAKDSTQKIIDSLAELQVSMRAVQEELAQLRRYSFPLFVMVALTLVAVGGLSAHH